MAVRSKLWPEGNESKNKMYIGRVSRGWRKDGDAREREGLVDRRGDDGERGRKSEGEIVRARERERKTDIGGRRGERMADRGRGAVEHVRLGRAAMARGSARGDTVRRGIAREGGVRDGTRREGGCSPAPLRVIAGAS